MHCTNIVVHTSYKIRYFLPYLHEIFCLRFRILHTCIAIFIKVKIFYILPFQSINIYRKFNNSKCLKLKHFWVKCKQVLNETKCFKHFPKLYLHNCLDHALHVLKNSCYLQNENFWYVPSFHFKILAKM